MVVEVGGAELNIGIPAIPHELGAHDLAFGVGVGQRLIEDQRISIDSRDPFDLEGLFLIHADAHQLTGLKALGAGELHAGRPGGNAGSHSLTFDGEWPDGLFVVEPGVYAVAGLHVELDKMDVQVGFAEEGVLVGVFQFTLEDDVNAVFSGVGADRQRNLQVGVSANGVLLIFQDVD